MINSTPGPWEQSIAEAEVVCAAVELVADLSPDDRELAVSSINAKRRTRTYKTGERYEPINLSDGWFAPRWRQAEDGTGGDHPKPLIRLPSGSVLDGVAPGGVLDPLPRRQRFSRARCDSCGCWISQRSARRADDGWIYCGVCNRGGASP